MRRTVFRGDRTLVVGEYPKPSIRERVFAALLTLGAAVLLYRTIVLMSEGALVTHLGWVAALLVVESVLDLLALVALGRWWLKPGDAQTRIVLRLAALVAVVHAIRVLIFVIGRTGRWRDFEFRSEYRPLPADLWTWGEVYFAATTAVIGLCVVLTFWLRRHRLARHLEREP